MFEVSAFHVTVVSEICSATQSVPKSAEFFDLVSELNKHPATAQHCCSNQPTRKRTSRIVLPPKRCFSFRRISDLEICSSS